MGVGASICLLCAGKGVVNVFSVHVCVCWGVYCCGHVRSIVL